MSSNGLNGLLSQREEMDKTLNVFPWNFFQDQVNQIFDATIQVILVDRFSFPIHLFFIIYHNFTTQVRYIVAKFAFKFIFCRRQQTHFFIEGMTTTISVITFSKPLA